jgi:anti-anti-sigma factor
MSVWQRRLPHEIWQVGVRGRLDQSLTPQLEEKLLALLSKGHNRIVVDLSDATYINSGGLRCLVSVWRKAREDGGDVVLSSLNARLQEIFTMIGFDRVFQIYADSNSAHEAISREQSGSP